MIFQWGGDDEETPGGSSGMIDLRGIHDPGAQTFSHTRCYNIEGTKFFSCLTYKFLSASDFTLL